MIANCGSMRDALTTNKGTKTEEFLVEKKSPLIIPPDFKDLPIPTENSKVNSEKKNSNIESLIVGSNDVDSKNNVFNDKNSSLEDFILKEINKN